jgi:superfamily II DNA or RNA helicase
MNNPKQLSLSTIRHACSLSSYERGRDYYAKGQVVKLTVGSEGTLFVQINSSVKGSVKTPYNQNIRIVWRPDYSAATIEGDCSCPVGFNCKHVAAVCLQYQDSIQAISPVPDSSCLDWLASLDAPAPQRDTYQEFIAYVLKPGRQTHEFTVEFHLTKEKKSGGLSKGRKTTLNNLRYSYAHMPSIQPEDVEITSLLLALSNSYTVGEPSIRGAAGSVALSKLVQTGRLYWQDFERSSPLKAADARELRLDWQQQKDGAYRLDVSVEPEALLILTDPPYYLDTGLGTIGMVDTHNLNTDQLRKVLSAPLIPPEHVETFSERLIVEHPGLPLPAPKKIELIQLHDLEPVPRLLLQGQPIDDHYLHFMALEFVYGEWALPALAQEPYSVVKTNRGFLRIQRDTEAEQLAVDRLAELGFAGAGSAHSRERVFFSSAQSPLDNAAHWGDFLLNVLPELEQEGWLIDTDESFRLNFQAAQTWDVEISESPYDWFEMRFNVDIDGQSLPLLPLIMPILEYYDLDDLPDRLNLHIGDHRYLTLPADKIKPFLTILIELFNSNGSLANDGALRLSRFNAASLADMEAHNYGLFRLSGGEALRELAQKLKNFAGIEEVAVPAGLKAELRNYQRHGLSWLQFLREYRFAGILADDMGLGKTIQALAHLLMEKQSGRMTAPCLIIAPTSLMGNWRREAERFTPDLKMLTLQGTDRKQHFDEISHYDLVLTTYPLLPRDEQTLLEQDYYYLILDEAQVIKNPQAKAARIVRQIKAQYRLCLTGTPMENHLGELWAQFDFLMPGFLGNNITFKKLYRTPIEVHGDNQQRARLTQRIAPFMLRRSKQDVATELPPKTEIIRSVPLGEKQAALYESIRLTMEKRVRDAIAMKGLSRSHITILDALLKLRQTCCDPRTLPLESAQKVKQSAKLDLLMEILPEQLEEGRRILVFSQFTRMIALIEDELNARDIAYSKLTGQTRKREEAIEQFKSGAVNVFLISLKAGGVGLNLTEADSVIIYDPWWNPAAETQAADRAYRIGQDKPVFVYKLITENTVEEKILVMQEKKRQLAEGIYKGGGEESLQLTAADLTALFEPL